MIVISILKSPENRANMQQRLLCAMVMIDMTSYLMWIFADVLMPKDASSFLFKTYGSKNTCSAQGFILQFNISSMIYNAILSFYYLLVIKYSWKPANLLKLEKWMHLFPIAFGLITASITLGLNSFHAASWNCWIAAPPEEKTKKYHLVSWLRMGEFYIPLWICILISLINMFRVYLHVKKGEKKVLRWQSHRGNSYQRYRHTKAVATQGLLYFAAFIFAWTFPTIVRLYEFQSKGARAPQWLYLVAATMIPCQGTFNAMIYFRLRFKKMRMRNPDKKIVLLMIQIVLATFCPCCHGDGAHRRPSTINQDIEPNISSFNKGSPRIRNHFATVLHRLRRKEKSNALKSEEKGMCTKSGHHFPSPTIIRT